MALTPPLATSARGLMALSQEFVSLTTPLSQERLMAPIRDIMAPIRDIMAPIRDIMAPIRAMSCERVRESHNTSLAEIMAPNHGSHKKLMAPIRNSWLP